MRFSRLYSFHTTTFQEGLLLGWPLIVSYFTVNVTALQSYVSDVPAILLI
jgi:hypothetical protein